MTTFTLNTETTTSNGDVVVVTGFLNEDVAYATVNGTEQMLSGRRAGARSFMVK